MRNTKLINIAVINLSMLVICAPGLCAADRAEMRRDARAALNHLYSISPAARHLGKSAEGVLVFPSIVKAGSIGAQQGYGALFAHERAIGYYKLINASYSVPKQVQKFGCALFFMSDDDLAQLYKSGGWEIGAGPSVVVAQENQKWEQQAAASASVTNQVTTIAPSAATIVRHASQVTHRDAMNDQQEPAPRPNDLTLDPKYRGFTPIPNMGIARPLMTTTPRKGVYTFAFGDRGLIGGLWLQRTKITAVHPD